MKYFLQYLLLGNQVSNTVNNTFTKEREEIAKTQKKIDSTVAMTKNYNEKIEIMVTKN